MIARLRRWSSATVWIPAPPEILAFMNPIDQICEAPPPRFLRSLHALIVGLFAALLLAAALVKVDIVVVASGRLTTDAAPIVIQPIERAVIRELHVKPGDRVTKGEILATLDPTFAQADRGALDSKLHSVRAQLKRLAAEQTGGALDQPADPSADDLMQSILFRQRHAQYASSLRMLDEEVARLDANLHAAEADRAAILKQVEVARSVETMRSTLMGLQAGSRLQYLEATANRMRAEREQQDAANQVPELIHAVQSKQAERQSFMDQWQRDISESIVALQGQEAELGGEFAKATRRSDLVVVSAPGAGVVLDMARRSAGSVLREAEPLMTIVPADATLIAEVMISSADIAATQPGCDVEIKVDAYPYQQHGILRGRLLSVSEDSASSEAPFGSDAPGVTSSHAVHRARIALLDYRLDGMPAGASMFPGMTVHADIKAGARSVLAYFLSPITRGLRESLREP